MVRRFLFVYFTIALSLFSGSATAKIYRLSILPQDQEFLERPRRPFPSIPKIFRILNLAGEGAPFSSFNSEFILEGGELKRIRSSRINHVLEMIVDQTTENLICQDRLGAGIPSDRLMPYQAWRERTVSPIDHQALSEMGARRYLDERQKEVYLESTHLVDPDRMVYIESLSWLEARQVLELFPKIPWARISEVEAPDGLGSLEVRALAEKGDPRVRLRIRRATIRLVASHVFHTDPKRRLQLYLDSLPFEDEYIQQGISLPKKKEALIYRYELGRASQIPGLEGEAEQLTALAGLIVWHHTMMSEDIRMNQKSDVRAVNADIFLHAVKKAHNILYANRLQANDHVAGLKPHDIVFHLDVRKLLAKTLPSLGLGLDVLKDISVKADLIELIRWDLDWFRQGETDQVTRHHPITIRVSRAMASRLLDHFTRDVIGDPRRDTWIRASLANYDHIVDYQFTETRAVDGYKRSEHDRIKADYLVSGMDSWSASSSVYVPAFIAALAEFFKGIDEEIELAVIVSPTPSTDHFLMYSQLIQRGFERTNIPFVAQIKMQKLMEIAETDREVAREMAAKPTLKSGTWRAIRDLNLLPGL